MPEHQAIPDFAGYTITSDGVVWSWIWNKRNRVFKLAESPREVKSIEHKGTCYRFVWLARNGRYVKRYVHRLVLLSFVGPCPKGQNTRHLDGSRSNNKLDNLKWGTPKEQAEDRNRHGTSALGTTRIDIQGQRHHQAKLTDTQAIEIFTLKGRQPCQELAQRFGVGIHTVYNIWAKRQWVHIHDTAVKAEK